jgi:hypothetical protein
VFGRGLDGREHVVDGAGYHDSQGLDLIDAGIGTIEGAPINIEKNLARQPLLERL